MLFSELGLLLAAQLWPLNYFLNLFIERFALLEILPHTTQALFRQFELITIGSTNFAPFPIFSWTGQMI